LNFQKILKINFNHFLLINLDMKKALVFLVIAFSLTRLEAQIPSFRFAFISDTHIGSPNGSSEEDLRRTVRDINAMDDIAFVVLTGDITELGTNEELKLAKQILDSLDVKWYIIPGNHDSGWSESGGTMFASIFGYDKFSFEYAGIRFLGCASGPYVRMSDGHVPRDAVNWLDTELTKIAQGQPVIFLNHYPIDNGLDNWYEVTDRLRKLNTWAILCGHGHANRAMNFEDIPGVMGRSNLRARSAIGGYNLVDIRNDSLIFSERRPGTETLCSWTGVKIEKREYDPNKKFPRPDYKLNEQYPFVKKSWEFSSDANIISTPAVIGDLTVVGNQNGEIVAITTKTGARKWSYRTGSSIFSSPAHAAGRIVVGSADSSVYCLDAKTGKVIWKEKTSAAVLGSPLIHSGLVYIGGSRSFYCFDLKTGKQKWNYNELKGPVVSTPVISGNMILFGAWDTWLYCLDRANGELIWKWSNGSTVRNFSPASCIPVVSDDVVYIVAPDRYISAIDLQSGKTLWRNNDATVRESIGYSEDQQYIFGKTMQDTIVAYRQSREKQSAAWKMHIGFGYEHVPSMLIEKQGYVFFGTKNGVVYCIDPVNRKTVWAHKIDNSMVNTVNVIDKHTIIASTMDGKVTRLMVEKY
jgi:outer membrane protein assembly factor BamB/predicted phosphodiesterase